MQKPAKQYEPKYQARQYGIPIYIRRESTLQKGGLLAGNAQQKRLEEIVMFI